MGLTCLAAAFLFGRYIHNRPAEIDQPHQVQNVDPIESFLAGGQAQPAAQPAPATPQFAPPSAELIPLSQQVTSAQSVPADRSSSQNPVTARPQGPQTKSVTPDFSELAARFRNSPLELGTGNNLTNGQSNSQPPKLLNATPPQLVIRQPKQTVSIRRVIDQRDRFNQTGIGSFANDTPANGFVGDRFPKQKPQSGDTFSSVKGQWRVSRPGYRNDQPQTIDDIYNQKSADYLRDETVEFRDGAAAQSVTSVTEPPLQAAPYQAQFPETPRASEPAQFADPPLPGQQANHYPQSVSAPSFAELRKSLDRDDPGRRFSSGRETVRTPHDFETNWQAPPKPRADPPQPETQQPPQRWNTNTQSRSNFAPLQNQQQQRTYRIQPGDRLQSISQKFYGTPDRYIELYKANRRVLDGITNIPGGVEIVIPDLN